MVAGFRLVFNDRYAPADRPASLPRAPFQTGHSGEHGCARTAPHNVWGLFLFKVTEMHVCVRECYELSESSMCAAPPSVSSRAHAPVQSPDVRVIPPRGSRLHTLGC